MALVLSLLGGALVIIGAYSVITPVPPQGDVSFTLEHYRRFFGTSYYLSVLWDSLVIAIGTTLLAFLLGYPAAYLLATTDSEHKNLYLLMLILPFWINVVVRTYAWRLILGSGGLVDWVLYDVTGVANESVQLLYSRGAIAIGLVHVFLPFMIIPIYVSLASIDRSGVEAAKNLGANRLVAFTEVTWPQSLPGVAAGVLLVFVMSFGAFVVPSLLGGRANIMIANVIGDMFGQLQEWGLGSAISMVFIVVVLTIVYVFNRWVNLGDVYGMGGDSE
ncbi:ABC transporter permease [Natrarchaeobius halalkaliphilus]|uniref:ABC transporter permease n=2 Tax=Natrarchaeobius halalkaliphilus TaxID=1679091 RepID=A0A3N6LZC7_9EURY|nr:ABC transporter permease [Natrarchaeobius halalkaliphilus]